MQYSFLIWCGKEMGFRGKPGLDFSFNPSQLYPKLETKVLAIGIL